MIEEIQEILKKVSTAKGITLFIVLFFLAIFVWSNMDFLTEVSFTFKNGEQESTSKAEKEKDESSGYPKLELGELYLPPAPVKSPSIVVFEIKNPGSDTAKNTHVSIDYGASKIISYEIIGLKKTEYSAPPAENSIITIDIKNLRPNESAYVYAHTSYPSFNRISFSSENVTREVVYTYKDYLNKQSGSSFPGFTIFLQFLAAFVLVITTIFFTFGILGKLNKLFGFNWDK